MYNSLFLRLLQRDAWTLIHAFVRSFVQIGVAVAVAQVDPFFLHLAHCCCFCDSFLQQIRSIRSFTDSTKTILDGGKFRVTGAVQGSAGFFLRLHDTRGVFLHGVGTNVFHFGHVLGEIIRLSFHVVVVCRSRRCKVVVALGKRCRRRRRRSSSTMVVVVDKVSSDKVWSNHNEQKRKSFPFEMKVTTEPWQRMNASTK